MLMSIHMFLIFDILTIPLTFRKEFVKICIYSLKWDLPSVTERVYISFGFPMILYTRYSFSDLFFNEMSNLKLAIGMTTLVENDL